MKTNVELKRQMGGFEIVQRTKDGYFDANALLKQWNENKNKKRFKDFQKLKSTNELIEEVVKREVGESSHAHLQVIIVQKGRKAKSGQTPNKYWVHPIMFLDFCMWLNPRFKYDVLKFIQDNLVDYRKKAGDAYRKMSTAVASLPLRGGRKLVCNITDVAKALNFIVCNRHISNVRNEMTEKEMDELVKLELLIAQNIEDGLISSYKQLIVYLRNKWVKKYSPKQLA